MEQKKRKLPYGMTREQERAASRHFGQHVSNPKAAVALGFSLLCCASPMLLGLRLWPAIPPVVQTGLISTEGTDDSMSRAVLVFGVPGLFCLLDFICHAQLWLNQKAERIPPMPVRLFGRWVLPVLSVLLCSFWLLRAAGEPVGLPFFLPCLLALLLLLTGVHFFDCPRGDRIGFPLRRIRYREDAWQKTHRAASVAWMSAGLLLLAVFFLAGHLPVWTAAVALPLLLTPLPASLYFTRK